MKYKVVGTVLENNERQKIIYGEFDEYAEAYDYKEWLENIDNWKKNPSEQPYIVSIEEVLTDGDTYFNDAMNGEQ